MVQLPSDPQPPPYGAREPDEFADERVRWLIRLRWGAIVGIASASALGWLGYFEGAAASLLLGTAIASAAFNAWLSAQRSHGPRAGVVHAYLDMGILTVCLWALGGVHTPFLANYVFHVAIVGILGGPRATLLAGGLALLASGLLALTEHVAFLHVGRWAPVPPLDTLSEVVAFTSVVGAVAYLISRAVGELKRREEALARLGDQIALEYEVLSHTLSELEVGLEVVTDRGEVTFRNKLAHDLAPQAERAELDGRAGRFAATLDGAGDERLYELLVFPLEGRAKDGGRRVMNLYLDRTSSVVEENGLLLAERLASLGRVAQGVAHELNTPLATVRTLAADMREALRELGAVEGGSEKAEAQRKRLLADVDESAAVVQDETRRLGRITQDLLARGDLARGSASHDVSLGSVVSRAVALVFAGTRGEVPVEIAGDIDRILVVGQRDLLVQVLVSLLQNASDAVGCEEAAAGGAKPIRISARQRGDEVHLLVEDDGPGIPEAIAARLFEPFVTTKPPGRGTGLGLYMSRLLVRQMNGELELSARAPRGTRATVVLPSSAPGSVVRATGEMSVDELARDVEATGQSRTA